MIKYRSDIDGLRALAVVPIMLFHAGFEWLSGGYIGVDIFFVISGYLIGSILLKELSQDAFTFKGFYQRRMRRIIPALLVVLIATLLAGYFFLLPDEYIDLAKSTLAAAAFVPNIYFLLTESTYFGLDIATTPLLHTWSLGVEEQFYIVFPAILYALSKLRTRRAMATVLVLLFILSLAANVYTVASTPKATFYLFPTRAWELLAGVILSLHILPEIKKSYLANLIALLGAGLILGALLLLDEQSLFPGINAVPPVLGAALIIMAGSHCSTLVSRLLSHKVLVGIGLISYSLYLWHWPVAVYTQLVWESEASKYLIVAVSMVLAYISYRFVESRYRKPTSPRARPVKLRELGYVAIVVSVLAGLVWTNNGLEQRIPPKALAAVASDAPALSQSACSQFTERADLRAEQCALGHAGAEPAFLLWGDSHSKAIAPALNEAARQANIGGLLISSGGCRPLLEVYRKGKTRCRQFNNRVEQFINNHPSIQHIFLAGYWRIPFTGKGYDNGNFLIMDDATSIRSPAENQRVFQRGMERTLAAFPNHNRVIIQDIPEIGSQFGKSISSHYIRRAWLNAGNTHALIFESGRDDFDDQFNQLVASLDENNQYIQLAPLLCIENQCPLLADNKLLYHDGDHLSEFGAIRLAPRFLRYFQNQPNLTTNR